MQAIGTVINYCTNDFRFIGKCIEEAKAFSQEIIIPVCTHLFDGTPENRELLEHTYAAHPDCRFIEFAYLPDRLYSPYHSVGPKDEEWAMYWTATARYIGYHYLTTPYLLFLDSDEIVEGEKMASWLTRGDFLQYDALRCLAFFYSLRPTFCATHALHAPLLVKRSTLAPLMLLNNIDRFGAYLSHPGPKRQGIVGLDGQPMVHHYSWVRTKEECSRKTQTWGHRKDADWSPIVEEAFSGKEEKSFWSFLTFQEIAGPPYFDPFAVPFPSGVLPTPENHVTGDHVTRIAERDLKKRELEHAFF